MATLETQLTNWDGKSKEDIQQIYDQFAGNPNLFPELVGLLANPFCERGASWLLKRHLEADFQLSPCDTVTCLQQLPQLQHWESRLHLLQSLNRLTLPKSEKRALEIFIRKGFSDTNKFVRAWSYDGFYQLAKQFPEYQQEVLALLDMAMKDEPASVKARIRNILKLGFD